MTTERPVLYVMVCGSSAARGVVQLVELAHRDGWRVCVIASPDGLKFIDSSGFEELTGYPVRSRYKHPLEPDLLPPPDAVVIAPATCNTVNKLAAGISDTLLLGIAVESIGRGVPVVVMPFTNREQAAFPAFARSLAALRTWGVTVVFDETDLPPARDGAAPLIDWSRVLAAVAAR